VLNLDGFDTLRVQDSAVFPLIHLATAAPSSVE
jgi:hypothetical protein